jgi:hypothetical protein
MDVLAELDQPEHIDMFADELRRAVLRADPQKVDIVADQWRSLLRDQGPAAAKALQRLIGEREIPIHIRSRLLEDLVEVIPDAEQGKLVVLVGRGHRDLQSQLRRSMARRAQSRPAARVSIVEATQRALEGALATPPRANARERLAPLVAFRAAVDPDPGSDFIPWLIELAQDERVPFGARVAAIRGLSELQSDTARAALVKLANVQLRDEVRRTQAGEILGWQVLLSLPAETAGALAAKARLLDDPAPRLASVAYAVAPLSADQAWLEASQRHAWPQVRQAALDRVRGPCQDKTIDVLAKINRPTRRAATGDRDRVVARAAVHALGRCGDTAAQRALVDLLTESRTDFELRAEAARQLVRHFAAAGSDTVAGVLGGEPSGALARRLATALRYAPEPTPKATAVLCARLAQRDDVSGIALQSLLRLHGTRRVCES